MTVIHQPVLAKELLECLHFKKGGCYIDGTLGTGGHALALLEKAGPDCLLIGIDRDRNAIEVAKERLKPFEKQTRIVHGNFFEMDRISGQMDIRGADGIYADLGLSSLQIETAERGFGFSREGPLDMRMDASQGMTALEKIKASDERELAGVLEKYGEERYAKKIARRMMEKMERGEMRTTSDLAELVRAVYPPKARFGRMHPATRTFQALRIWVNEELKNLERFLKTAPALLNPEGRLCVLSYHSLEDRLVKHTFRRLAKSSEMFSVLTKKPVVPGEEEVKQNPRSRSAKLRALKRAA